MQIPILKQGAYLIVTLQSALSDSELLQLRTAVMDRVGTFRSKGVIIDVTAIDVMDSFACRTLRDIAYMIKLRGAETVIAGIQPEVAYSIVQLSSTLEGVTTALDLEEALDLLTKETGRGGTP